MLHPGTDATYIYTYIYIYVYTYIMYVIGIVYIYVVSVTGFRDKHNIHFNKLVRFTKIYLPLKLFAVVVVGKSWCVMFLVVKYYQLA